MSEVDGLILRFLSPSELSVSTTINPERANWSVVMDTDSLEDPDWSYYPF